ncbi:MAG: hypothetical protein PHD06_00705 [Bacteroidales bacterium]|jgi:uncharacterized membrane protein YgcG|nr:hypothetical protein [Bacteroidales bacterium]MDD4383674.1 hypothetical protein [Bacteroidales bacterium]MDY0197244.1 hypothetical protein [Tenuifilaceae bacterium]
MKTKLKLFTIALLAVTMGSCSTSMQMSKTSSNRGDDLYFNPSDSYSSDNSQKSPSSSSLKIEDLERKYQNILASDTTGSIDTLVYKSEESGNPYDRILSTSYQDSYERRLKARSNPSYGLNDWTIQYSDNYWYASAYDPAYYNIIVMGGNVWVEPYYISSMFGWPRYSSFGYWGSSWGRPYLYGFGSYGYGGYWGYSNHYSSWWNTYGWGYNNGYWNGYYGNNWNNQPNAGNYHYGQRPSQGTVNYGNRPAYGDIGINGLNSVNRDRRIDLSDKQVVLGNTQGREPRPEGTQVSTRPIAAQDPNRINTTRPISQDPTRKEVIEPNRGNNNIAGPARESKPINPTRVSGENRGNNRAYNPTYTRPNPANSSDFNKPTRNYPTTETARPVSSRPSQQVARPIRGSSNESGRTFNSPPRISSPSVSRPNNSSSGSSSNRGSSPSNSSVGSSSSSRQSSGSSSGSSSSSRSSSGSSSNSSRKRDR